MEHQPEDQANPELMFHLLWLVWPPSRSKTFPEDPSWCGPITTVDRIRGGFIRWLFRGAANWGAVRLDFHKQPRWLLLMFPEFLAYCGLLPLSTTDTQNQHSGSD